MENADLGQMLVRLMRVTAILALPADDQAAFVHGLGTAPLVDELALEFHDRVLMGPQFVQEGWLTEFEIAAIQEIDIKLKAMSGSGHEELWILEALRSQEWGEIRSLARAFLELA